MGVFCAEIRDLAAQFFCGTIGFFAGELTAREDWAKSLFRFGESNMELVDLPGGDLLARDREAHPAKGQLRPFQHILSGHEFIEGNGMVA